MKKFLAGLFVLASSLGSVAAPLIVGGSDVSPKDEIAKMTVAVHLADVYYADQERFGTQVASVSYCSGVIFDEETILTAAHCFGSHTGKFNYRGNHIAFGVDIRMGVKNITRPTTGYKILESGYAPWSWGGVGNDEGDLAIVKFSGGLPEGYKPAKYFSKLNLPLILKEGMPIILVGYGDDKKFGKGVLRKVENNLQKIQKYNLWVGEEGRTACHGDSGGPAFVRHNEQYYLVGVSSRTTERGCRGMAIYSKFSGLDDFDLDL